MRSISGHFRALLLGIAGALLLAGSADAAEVRVMISGGLTAAYNALVPEFERQTGNKVLTAYGPSMGTTVNAIPVRLERGEPADVLIMVGYALGDLIKQGKVNADSRVDLVKSPIGIAVKAGAPKPDVSTPEKLKAALLAAKTVGYSQGASGQHFLTVLQKLGITDPVKGKAVVVQGRPVGAAIATGEAEIGVQQVAELRPVPGVDQFAELPGELQKQIPYSAGVSAKAKDPATARALVSFLGSAQAQDVLKRKGMDLP